MPSRQVHIARLACDPAALHAVQRAAFDVQRVGEEAHTQSKRRDEDEIEKRQRPKPNKDSMRRNKRASL